MDEREEKRRRNAMLVARGTVNAPRAGLKYRSRWPLLRLDPSLARPERPAAPDTPHRCASSTQSVTRDRQQTVRARE